MLSISKSSGKGSVLQIVFFFFLVLLLAFFAWKILNILIGTAFTLGIIILIFIGSLWVFSWLVQFLENTNKPKRWD